MTRRSHDLYGDVAALLAVEPTLSANEIANRLREDGRGRNRNDVLKAVRTLRAIPGVAQSGRGPGRPENAAIPFFRSSERAGP
jgi:hypothetical protein